MTEEEKNKEKRIEASLTTEEYLTFFFFPYNDTGRLGSFTNSYNQSEDERFAKHGFETKIKQAKSARELGFLFYTIIVFILMVLAKHLDFILSLIHI